MPHRPLILAIYFALTTILALPSQSNANCDSDGSLQLYWTSVDGGEDVHAFLSILISHSQADLIQVSLDGVELPAWESYPGFTQYLHPSELAQGEHELVIHMERYVYPDLTPSEQLTERRTYTLSAAAERPAAALNPRVVSALPHTPYPQDTVCAQLSSHIQCDDTGTKDLHRLILSPTPHAFILQTRQANGPWDGERLQPGHCSPLVDKNASQDACFRVVSVDAKGNITQNQESCDVFDEPAQEGPEQGGCSSAPSSPSNPTPLLVWGLIGGGALAQRRRRELA